MPMQMVFPPQPSPAEKLQAPTSASGRVRRQLPQVKRVPFLLILSTGFLQAPVAILRIFSGTFLPNF